MQSVNATEEVTDKW